MNIKAKIDEIVDKVKQDKDFSSKFKKDPVSTIQSVIGTNLSNDQIHALINGVKAKASLDKAGGLLDSFKKRFK